MKRLGQFWVSKHLVEDETSELRQVLALLGFVPVRVTYFWEREAFQYLGHSPMFRQIEANSRTPEYAIVIRRPHHTNLVTRVEARELEAIPTGPMSETERAEMLANLSRSLGAPLQPLPPRGEADGNEEQPR